MLNSMRFWSKVNQTKMCWIWTGAKYKNGYGAFRFFGKNTTAHRVAYILTRGQIPTGMFVCHKCDTPACVRPSHLFLGTQKDNMRDASLKGRMPSGENHYTHSMPELIRKGSNHWTKRFPELLSRMPKGTNHWTKKKPHLISYGARANTENFIRGDFHWTRVHPPKGDSNNSAKLTSLGVLEIRKRVARGEKQKYLANEFGVTPSAINCIIKHKSWNHI